MRITCLGAARTVTGSSYLVEPESAGPFLVDCGMFQGGRQLELRNWNTKSYRVDELQAIFITHAHIDHSGLVPKLVRAGYSGPVYASRATCELLKILWLDSAHIQEMEANWQTRKNKRQGKGEVEALYETPDAEAAIGLLKPVDMDCHQEILPGVDVCLVRGRAHPGRGQFDDHRPGQRRQGLCGLFRRLGPPRPAHRAGPRADTAPRHRVHGNHLRQPDA